MAEGVFENYYIGFYYKDVPRGTPPIKICFLTQISNKTILIYYLLKEQKY